MDCSYQAIIEVKKSGGELHPEQVRAIARAVAYGDWPDYQIAAILMAIRLRGMTSKETVALTLAMAQHSQHLNMKKAGHTVVDKHSTGGVGDGTSLVLAPLGASLGLIIPMMSGRSLGFTGGTLDKLESAPGFDVRLSKDQFVKQIKRLGVAMFGQTQELAPVDRKLYALRDAISAVDSLPLVVSSIVSKKLVEGLDGIVFDVKFGRGAIFRDPKDSQQLAKQLTAVARASGLKARAVLTRMEEPLGRAIGNSLEMEQAWNILSGRLDGLDDYMDVTFELLYHMLDLGGLVKSREESKKKALNALNSGSALALFKQMLKAQGVAAAASQDLPKHLPRAKRSWEIVSPKSGWISFIDARKTADSTLNLRSLRRKAEDTVDHAAGVLLLKKSGEPVKAGEPLARLFASQASDQECKIAQTSLLEAFTVSKVKPKNQKIIVKYDF